MEDYITRKEASNLLGIHYLTLYKIAERNEIETLKVGKQTLYNVKKYLRDKKIDTKIKKRKICYCRVSSKKQKEDLARQIEYMKQNYPYHEIIEEIGSGLNFERKGLKEILKSAINGEIGEIVVTYKDRLVRFGFELIEWIIKSYSDGEIKVINNSEEKTPQQ